MFSQRKKNCDIINSGGLAFSWQCIPVNVTTVRSYSERNPILFSGNGNLQEVIAHLELISKHYTLISYYPKDSCTFKLFQIAIPVMKFMFKPSLNSELLRTSIRVNGIPISQTGQRTDQLFSALANAAASIYCKTFQVLSAPLF